MNWWIMIAPLISPVKPSIDQERIGELSRRKLKDQQLEAEVLPLHSQTGWGFGWARSQCSQYGQGRGYDWYVCFDLCRFPSNFKGPKIRIRPARYERSKWLSWRMRFLQSSQPSELFVQRGTSAFWRNSLVKLWLLRHSRRAVCKSIRFFPSSSH